jgi:hypothetical protein
MLRSPENELEFTRASGPNQTSAIQPRNSSEHLLCCQLHLSSQRLMQVWIGDAIVRHKGQRRE